MKKLPVISMLGCGWLGFPLACKLIEKGYQVKGSATSAPKLELMSEHQIDPFLVQIGPQMQDSDIADFLQCDILLVSIPPRGEPENYIQQMQLLVKALENFIVSQVILFSSTAVYGDTNSTVTEASPARPETANAKAILEAENLVRTAGGFTGTIIRFAGLVGPGRHPGRFLAGKKDISNGLAPVNLVHLDDCIALVTAIIQQGAFGRIYNACAPHHPTRQDFYRLAAQVQSLAVPEFISELKSWKVVSSIHTAALNYSYQISNWADWLQSTRLGS